IMQDPTCASDSVALFDDAAAHEVCFRGLGTVKLADYPRGGGTWAGAVRHVQAGPHGGALSHAVCPAVACPMQMFSALASADVADDGSDLLSIFELKPFPDTRDGVHHFYVSDGNLASGAAATAAAPTIDFVWSGDRWTSELATGNQRMIVGHYM